MSKSNTAENSTLGILYVGTAIPWNANVSIWVQLFTADPGEAGSIASECAYGSYARQAITRATGFGLAGDTLTNAALVQFPECTSGSETITHVGYITTVSGAGTIIHSGALNSSRSVSTGIQPQFQISALVVTED